MRDYAETKDFLKEKIEGLGDKEKSLLNNGLGKWALLLVNGKPVSEEKALEFIIQTDGFFYNGGNTGNNSRFEKEVCDVFGMTHQDDYETETWDTQMKQNWDIAEKLGVLHLKYLESNQISSCYIGGPNGLIDIQGRVFYHQNVGKYPDTEDIYLELLLLAERFEWLDLVATLHYGEDSGQPIISFIVKDGTVTIIDPKEAAPLHEKLNTDEVEALKNKSPLDKLLERDRYGRTEDGRTFENAIPLETLRQYYASKSFDML